MDCFIAGVHAYRYGYVGMKSVIKPDLPAPGSGWRGKATADNN
jgi:hypothetical protein